MTTAPRLTFATALLLIASGASSRHKESAPSGRSPLLSILQEQRLSRGHYGGGAEGNATTHTKSSGTTPKINLDHLVAHRKSYGNAATSIQSPVLLALIHSSEVPWPARLEVLNNALVTLEGSLLNGEGNFDLVVVLDSNGQLMRKNECRNRKVTLVHTTPVEASGKELCDSLQLVQETGLPYAVAKAEQTAHRRGGGGGYVGVDGDTSGVSGSTGVPAQGSRRLKVGQGHVHPAEDPKLGPGEATSAWPASKYRILWAAAARYAERNDYKHLVVAVSSSLIPSTTIARLAAASAASGGAVIPVFDRRAWPPSKGQRSDSGFKIESPHVFVGSHPDEAPATQFSGGSGESVGTTEGLRQYMEHPLNYERASNVIDAAQVAAAHSHLGAKVVGPGLAFGQPRRVAEDSSFCGYQSMLPLVVAMPLDTWKSLEEKPGEISLDDCDVVKRNLAARGGLWVHHGAYIVSRPPHRAISLLLNEVGPVGSAASWHPPASATTDTMAPPDVAPLHQGPRHAKTLVTFTCAGVWSRTLSAFLSLEASAAVTAARVLSGSVGREHGHHNHHRDGGRRRLSHTPQEARNGIALESGFDIMLAVTPRDGDTSEGFARAAGVPVLVQPYARGLTDLWNLVLRHCLNRGYENCFIANNDVLVGSGTVGVMVSALQGKSGADLAIPLTRRGAGTYDLDQYSSIYQANKQQRDPKVPVNANDNFLDSPSSFQRIQVNLLPPNIKPSSIRAFGGNHVLRTAPNTDASASTVDLVARPAKGWMAFFFGMRASWVAANLLPDGSGRLWNDTRWKNYAQEKNLPPTVKIAASQQAYVHHFRGGTLDSANCKNGWLDCATWQEGHRPDMASEWFKPEDEGL